MKPDNKFIRSLSILILSMIFVLRINGQDKQVVPASTHDLSSYSIEELRKFANELKDDPSALPFYKVLLDKSLKENHQEAADEALFGILEHYLYEQDLQQLNHWIDFTDSLVTTRDDHPNIYYDAHRNRAVLLLEKKDYEQAITETIKLYNKAERTEQQYGMITSSEMLGYIYLSSQQYTAAIEAYQNAYERLKKTGLYPNTHVKIMSSWIEALLYLNDTKKVEPLLKEFEKILVWKESEDQRLGIQRETNWYRWQLYSFYTDLYTREGQIDEAAEYLDKASQFFKEGMAANYDFSIYYYLYAKASYYKKIKNYDNALATADYILKDYYQPTSIKIKIDILREIGQFKEAYSLYEDLYQITQKTNNEAFVRQVNNLQALYDKNDQQISQRELQLIKVQISAKHRLLIFSVGASIILLTLIIFLAKFLRHTFRLKNELEKEKKALITSQEKLQIEKRNAERADQQKDAFIASISHEIRTPLNTIVGFSTLLSEMTLGEDEKKEFIELIEKNSSLLLDLVNDVLDLSRLESGRTKMAIAPCELGKCCQKLLDGTKEALSPGVALTFSPSVSPFFLETDSHLLSQLLDNLLSNAAKFTTQGTIDLAYETDDAKRQVTFAITDTGPGIPMDKQHIIFERFEKLNEYTQGSGLGLTLCRTIAAKLGGSICIDTEYTEGARFVFIHPYGIPKTTIPNEN